MTTLEVSATIPLPLSSRLRSVIRLQMLLQLRIRLCLSHTRLVTIIMIDPTKRSSFRPALSIPWPSVRFPHKRENCPWTSVLTVLTQTAMEWRFPLWSRLKRMIKFRILRVQKQKRSKVPQKSSRSSRSLKWKRLMLSNSSRKRRPRGSALMAFKRGRSRRGGRSRKRGTKSSATGSALRAKSRGRSRRGGRSTSILTWAT